MLPDLLQEGSTARVIDVGSGAGFPGLPLKIARPSIRLTLLDSVRKRTAFLDHLVGRLGQQNVEAVTARAEDLAHDPAHRDHYDVAVSRAVAELPTLLELCLPFLRTGGRFVAPRRGDLSAQQAAAQRAVRELGGEFRQLMSVELGTGYEGYGLLVVDKVGPTPERYPRRAGVPAKRPLV